MPEVVGTFLSAELWHERTNCSIEARNSAGSNLSQQGFEFAVRQLDGIEVGRILRQVANCRPRPLDRLADAGDFVGLEVIHHHDVIALERWDEALLDIGNEHLSRHRPVDHHRRGHFVVTQGSHESDCLPFSERDVADQPDASRSPPPEPHHICADRGLINKHQAGGIKHTLLSNPMSARSGHVCSLPFRRLQAFF
jgi:hypothetical protein